MQIPILVYHRLTAEKAARPQNEEDYYTVTAADFRAQMEFLRKNKYSVIGIKELANELGRWEGENRKSKFDSLSSIFHSRPVVLITLDDGYASNYTLALPILKEFGFTATFFITTDNIGCEGFMSAREIKKASDGGITIGSHGMSHRFLTALADSEAEKELQYSKISLEAIIEKPVNSLSVPGGFYNRRIKQLVKAAGYSAVYTSDFGVNSPGCDPFSLKRIPVKCSTGIEDFRRMLNAKGTSVFFRKASWKAKYALKKVIGVDTYTAIKEHFIKYAKR